LSGPASTPSWEDIGVALRPGQSPSLWRTFCDGLNQAWLGRRLGKRRWKAALKTDAFDEAVGEGVYPLLETAARSCVIDASVSTCRLAATRYPRLAATACDVSRLPFTAGAFDLVISISTLDHFASLSELERALGCLGRVMEPGGRLMLTLDNLDNPLVRLRNALPWRLLNRFGLVPYPVGVTAGAAELRRLLARAGFELKEMTTLMHVPRALAVALSAILNGRVGPRLARLFCRSCMAFETLGKLPTARWSGNYIAAAAVKPAQSKGGSTLPS